MKHVPSLDTLRTTMSNLKETEVMKESFTHDVMIMAGNNLYYREQHDLTLDLQAEGADLRTTLPPHTTKTASPNTEPEITPIRTINDRLGGSSKTKADTNSGSKDRRPALERFSEPEPAKELSGRRAPSFESGRLQDGENRGEEEVYMEQEQAVEPITGTERVPASV
ncbi:hypothetical protein DY000_02042268 [Brassica cretica]|uniref:Bromo domain-containing protein n=1 Tax=Brassica cretica TaxID=69181 RepID=A0ABQ7BNJ2_BRACR|nr:hypothetical protein DY000_02042268 [Brassica cretica]